MSELAVRLRAAVPAELVTLPAWLHWRYEEGTRKVPYYASGPRRNGTMDTPDDRARMVTFEEALRAAEARGPDVGIGLALGVVPGRTELPISGIDFDHCISASGDFDERVLQVLAAANSYAEVSPSGTGIKLFGYGDIGTTKRSDLGLEIYSRARYFTVTGRRINRAEHLSDLTAAAALARKLYGVGDEHVREPREYPRPEHRHAGMDGVLEHVLGALDNVQPAAPGEWNACCPAHAATSKSRSSLHVTDAGDRVLLYCRGGCSQDDVLEAAGLALRDLFAEPATRAPELPPVDTYAEEEREAIKNEGTQHSVKNPFAWKERFMPLREAAKPDLATATIAIIRYVLELLLARGFVTLLSGHGDVGKSYLALVIAAHVACGRRWAELACVTGRVLFVSLEDTAELIWLRLRRICEVYGLDFAAVAANITVLDVAEDADGALAFEHADGGTRKLMFTAALDIVRARAAGHDLVILDNASDAYDANENERRLVRRFVRELQRIARACDGAMCLLTHLDKVAARYGANGESYSGSTAWHNSARCRIALVEGDAGLELRHEKNNLGPKLRHAIALERGEHGVPVPLSRAEHAQRADADCTAVITAISAAIEAGITIPTARTGSRTAIHVLAARPELPEDLASDGRRLWDAITKLERDGRIRRETYRTEDRKQRERFTC